MMYDTDRFGAEYQHLRDYVNNPIPKEGYTPSAAIRMYPDIKDMNLTKIVHIPDEGNITRGFALLFLLPEQVKPTNFEQEYSVFEQFYYNGTEICKVTGMQTSFDIL